MSHTADSARTDMAVEFVGRKPRGRLCGKVRKTQVIVDEKLSEKLRRPKGTYVTVESPAALSADRAEYKPIIREIASTLKSLTADCKSFLAVGVGNPLLTADALGSRTVALLKVNRGFNSADEKELSAFSPGVSGVTGIESFDFADSIAGLVKPDCVLIIDSLASAAVSRLGSAFQICDSGLVPGSGVGGGKRALNAETLKVKKVVSVGVPLVVHAETIIRDAIGERSDYEINESVRNLVVTPKDVDIVMGECAHIIAESINMSLGL
ncbi:MAG: GPR endopeptidase [Clostridia bacterium]|nr:GPR endopeptidase [Clostridia bacterium]